jgi:hypothetical protein
MLRRSEGFSAGRDARLHGSQDGRRYGADVKSRPCRQPTPTASSFRIQSIGAVDKPSPGEPPFTHVSNPLDGNPVFPIISVGHQTGQPLTFQINAVA